MCTIASTSVLLTSHVGIIVSVAPLLLPAALKDGGKKWWEDVKAKAVV